MDENFYHFQLGWVTPVTQPGLPFVGKMSKRRQYEKPQSDTDSSSESEVEYEPIVVKDDEGNEYVVPPTDEATASSAPLQFTKSATGQMETVQITPTVLKKAKAKKGKVFASKDHMLALVESVNNVQDAKIKEKLDRDMSFLQRSAEVSAAIQERKQRKQERLEKIKDNLRKGGVRLHGENKRKVKEIREERAKEVKEKRSLQKAMVRNAKPKKKVKFAE